MKIPGLQGKSQDRTETKIAGLQGKSLDWWQKSRTGLNKKCHDFFYMIFKNYYTCLRIVKQKGVLFAG